jgi:4-hydroxythreonine-4-phosphate dehydrogenase
MAPSAQNAPIAITMGEPAGVGPELIARLWKDRAKHDLPPFLYVGSDEALKVYAPDLPTVKVTNNTIPTLDYSASLPVLDIPLNEPVEPGTLCPANGASVIDAISTATQHALDGSISAVVTAPIHKAALYGVGFDAPGHTEYLARLCGMDDDASIMMLATEGLRVVPVTVHVPFKDVPKKLTTARIVHAGMVTALDLKHRFGIAHPRLAVAGLNPHAGEGGTIGMEEATHILPAIWELRDNGIEVSDPQPADTLFHAEARQTYDAVLCMYHDQALIPLKTLDFWGGVNITLGLPIIRTSPDHGTALTLAGEGAARTESMLAAIKMAHTLSIASKASD